MHVDEGKIRSDFPAGAQRPHADLRQDELEALQEGVDVDVGQLLALVHLVRRIDGAC